MSFLVDCTHTIKKIIFFSINTKYQAYQSLSRNIFFYKLSKFKKHTNNKISLKKRFYKY